MTARRAGLTLAETVVVLAILAALALVLVPAVLKAREAAQRAACQNNLRQLGTAALQFHDRLGVFPTTGGYGGEEAYVVLTGPAGGPCADGWRGGVGHPGRPPEDQPGSWAYSLWPDLDAAAAREATGPSGGQGVCLPVLLCPARGRAAARPAPDADPLFPGLSCASVPAWSGPWARADYSANGLALPPRGGRLLRLARLSGGSAHVVLLGEKALDVRAYDGGWYWDGPAFASGLGSSRTGTRVVRDFAGEGDWPDWYANAWGGPHVGGANFLFADGAVRAVRYGGDGDAMLRLLAPSKLCQSDKGGDGL
jgi:prepilin-type processing-associated H-X9-DG protein